MGWFWASPNLLIVLPILADQGKALIRQGGLSDEDAGAAVDVIVPASFNFPHAGKLLQLSFILFAAWFTESAMSVAGYIGSFGMARALRLRSRPLVSATALTLGVVLIFVVTSRLYFISALKNAYDKDKVIAQMQRMQEEVPPRDDAHRSGPTLDRIRRREILRVGYARDSLPFAYVNAAGKVVGFDVAMAHKLAKQLGVGLELVPIEYAQVGEALNSGYCDIVMSSIAMTPERTEHMTFSVPYLDMTLAFVVEDFRREQFNSRDALLELDAPRIGVFSHLPYYTTVAQALAPQAELVPIRSPKEFLQDRTLRLDALFYVAEMGSALSLLYPKYTVAIPYPEVITVPLAYPVALGDHAMINYVNMWVELKKQDGTIQKLYAYWILGKNAVPPQPRWSVVRDVLNWTD